MKEYFVHLIHYHCLKLFIHSLKYGRWISAEWISIQPPPVPFSETHLKHSRTTPQALQKDQVRLLICTPRITPWLSGMNNCFLLRFFRFFKLPKIRGCFFSWEVTEFQTKYFLLQMRTVTINRAINCFFTLTRFRTLQSNLFRSLILQEPNAGFSSLRTVTRTSCCKCGNKFRVWSIFSLKFTRLSVIFIV